MTTPILRGLAKAYSESLIDRKVYIRERRELIDNIVSGAAELVAYVSPTPKRPPDDQRTFSDGEDTVELPKFDVAPAVDPPPAQTSNKRSSLLIPFIVVVLGCVAAVAWWWQSNVQEQAILDLATPPIASEQKIVNATESLLGNFLDNNAWRDGDISAFMLAWNSEPAADRAALHDDPSMRRAADSIAQKILDENALMNLGDRAESLVTQRLLLDLAAALAIDNDRFKRQELEWRSRSQASSVNAGSEEASVPPALDEEATAPPPSVDAIASLAADVDAVPAAPAQAMLEALSEPADEKPARDDAPVAETAARQTPRETLSTLSPAPLTPPVAAATQATSTVTKTRVPAVPASATSVPKKSGCRAALAKQRRPYCRDMLSNKIKAPLLAVLPAGSIEIGGRDAQEQPRHNITIARPFAIGIFEVSAAEFNVYCEDAKQRCPPQPWSDPNFPVVNVSWSQADTYTKWLSANSGATYRLPSESEWEYAARGGTTSPYPFGDEVLPTHARFSFRNIESQPLAANDKSINRNNFRLYHMIGNVREWVLDAWHADHAGAPADGSARGGAADQRVARGGAYHDGADDIRSASRVQLPASSADDYTGFRILREVQ